MTDLRAGGAADLRAPGATDLRGGATDLRGGTDLRGAAGATEALAGAGGTERRTAGGATDLREMLAFADDLSLFLGIAAGLPDPTQRVDRLLTLEAYYTCASFPNFDELSLQRRTPERPGRQ